MNGSDAPIEELDPLAGIRAGVLRTLDDRPAWHPEQALTVEEALGRRRHAGLAPGDEHRRGKLIPGFLADLVVLDRDPLACEPEELPEIRVVATMLGGRGRATPALGLAKSHSIRHKVDFPKPGGGLGFRRGSSYAKRNDSSKGR